MNVKQPSETISLVLAFGVALASIDSAVVVARGLVIGGPSILLNASAIDGSNVEVDLSGGVDGERYLVTVRVTSSAGQALEREAELAVVDFGFAVPTLVSPYLTATAFVDRLGLDAAIRLTDTEGSGRIDGPRLQGALIDSQSEVDGYLAGRYLVPLATVPQLVATLVFDLTVARLWTSDLPEGVKDRRDRAQAQLRDIAKSVITLPGAELLTPSVVSPTPVLFQAPARVFSRDRLTGF